MLMQEDKGGEGFFYTGRSYASFFLRLPSVGQLFQDFFHGLADCGADPFAFGQGAGLDAQQWAIDNFRFVEGPIIETPRSGDLNNDGYIDRDDVNLLKIYRNQPASACPKCDIDGDGVITVLDARKLVRMCDCPRCLCD